MNGTHPLSGRGKRKDWSILDGYIESFRLLWCPDPRTSSLNRTSIIPNTPAATMHRAFFYCYGSNRNFNPRFPYVAHCRESAGKGNIRDYGQSFQISSLRGIIVVDRSIRQLSLITKLKKKKKKKKKNHTKHNIFFHQSTNAALPTSNSSLSSSSIGSGNDSRTTIGLRK